MLILFSKCISAGFFKAKLFWLLLCKVRLKAQTAKWKSMPKIPFKLAKKNSSLRGENGPTGARAGAERDCVVFGFAPSILVLAVHLGSHDKSQKSITIIRLFGGQIESGYTTAPPTRKKEEE